MDYRIWKDDEDWDRWARLAGEPREIEEFSYMLSFGEPARAEMPTEVTFDINPEFGIELADSVPNSSSIYVISDRLRALIASTDSDMEIFPARIRNARGRIEDAPYFILNVLTRHRCVDMERSEFIPNMIRKGQISKLLRAVIDTTRIGTPSQIFRIGETDTDMLVREDLAQKIEAAGMTGLALVPPEDFNREWR